MQRSLLTGGLAAVALAVAPGLAGASVVDVPDRPYVLVPEGKVEHTIVTTDFTGEFAIPGVIPRHAEVETWVGRDHVRQLYRDARTRTVMQECSETAAAMTCWRRDGGISVIPNERQPSFGWRSRASEAGSLRAGIERGWYAKTGERTVGGRLAHVYESTDEEVDECGRPSPCAAGCGPRACARRDEDVRSGPGGAGAGRRRPRVRADRRPLPGAAGRLRAPLPARSPGQRRRRRPGGAVARAPGAAARRARDRAAAVAVRAGPQRLPGRARPRPPGLRVARCGRRRARLRAAFAGDGARAAHAARRRPRSDRDAPLRAAPRARPLRCGRCHARRGRLRAGHLGARQPRAGAPGSRQPGQAVGRPRRALRQRPRRPAAVTRPRPTRIRAQLPPPRRLRRLPRLPALAAPDRPCAGADAARPVAAGGAAGRQGAARRRPRSAPARGRSRR